MGAVLASALVSGSIYALIAAGFALAFRVSSVFNLSHGMLVIAAGYLNYGLRARYGLPSWGSIPASIAIVGLLGFVIEAKLIPSAREVGLKPVEILVVSWLLMLVIQDLVGILSENQSVYAGSTTIEEGRRHLWRTHHQAADRADRVGPRGRSSFLSPGAVLRALGARFSRLVTILVSRKSLA